MGMSPPQNWTPFFPGWSFSCALRPDAASNPLKHGRNRSLGQSWRPSSPGDGGRESIILEQDGPAAPRGRLWNSILLLGTPVCSPAKSLFVRAFFVVRGEFPLLWADLLTFSSETAESCELKGGSPAEGLAENLVRVYLAFTQQDEYGQTDVWSYI